MATDTLLITVLSNALVAGVLAGLVAMLSIRVQRASILHVLWIVVLVRMVAPAIVPIPVLPQAAMPDVAVEMRAVGPVALPPVASDAAPAIDPKQIAIALWLVGIVAISGVAIGRIRRMHRIVGQAEMAAPKLQSTAENVARRLGVSTPPVLLSAEKMPPALWAIGRRPRIVLPSDLVDTLDDDKIEALLAHETAHLARRDHLVRWLEMVVTVACWWNPLAWLASRQIRRAEERSCDEKVVATFPNLRRAYAESLITTLRFLSTATTTRVPAAAGMADLSEVQGRLTNIMKSRSKTSTNTAVRWLLACVVVAVLTASPLLMARSGGDTELPEIFNDTITLELDGASLNDVLQTFSKLTNVRFLVSGDATAPVTLALKDKTVYEALDLLAKVNDLQWFVRDGEVHVYSPSKDAEPMLVGSHDGQDVFRFIEGVFEEPKKLGGPAPKYPEESRKAGSRGFVLLDVLIGADGSVSDIVVKKSPDNLLSQAAMEAVELWTFQPALRDGQPVVVRYIITIRFNLK